jgi:hypothetical protein
MLSNEILKKDSSSIVIIYRSLIKENRRLYFTITKQIITTVETSFISNERIQMNFFL